MKKSVFVFLATAATLLGEAGWAKFKPGSYVKYHSTTAVSGMKMASDTKMTLVSVTADHATVETEVTTMGNTTKSRSDMPLKPTKNGMPASTMAAKKGSETVTIAGKSIACEVFETDTETNGMKTHTRSWISEQVPGGLVKSVTAMTGAAKSDTTMELVEFK